MFGRSRRRASLRVVNRRSAYLLLAFVAVISKLVGSFSTVGIKSTAVKAGVSSHYDSKLASSNPFFATESGKSPIGGSSSSSNNNISSGGRSSSTGATESSSSTRQSTQSDFGPKPPPLGELFDPTPDALIAKARVIIATDLGIQDPAVLAEDFLWIRPLADKPLGRVDYLAAGNFFNLRSAFPDLDYRAHDFRIDVDDPLTVRCTSRPVGTMRGPLRLRNEVVQANGKILRGPPEAISMTFDESTGKLVKLCSEFVLDRQVGNTNGLSGVMAAATVAGVPPSDWEVYPAPAVIARFFGRPIEQLRDPTTFLAPFPETVMISLTKGVLFANLGVEDSSLLSKGFNFLTPSVGPIPKGRFLESYAAQQFGDFMSDFSFSNYRVDPYDPYRVWVDVKLSGSGLEGPPLAYSFTFDDDGFCTRITGGAVMDPSIGNTGGLSGAEGIRYALGEGSPDVATRPLPVALGRLRKSILSPVTKIDADEFVLSPVVDSDAPRKEDASAIRKRILKEAKIRIEKEEAAKEEMKAAVMAAQTARLTPRPPPPKVFTPEVRPPLVPPPSIDFPPRTETPKRGIPQVDFSSFLSKAGPTVTEEKRQLQKVEKVENKVLESAKKATKPNTKRPTLEIPKIRFPQPSLELPKIDIPMPTNRDRPVSTEKDTAGSQKSVQKEKLELLQKKQDEVKKRIALEAEKKRLAAEEARQKLLEDQKESMEEAEKKRLAAAEARQKVLEDKKKAIEEVEKKRLAAEEARQKQIEEKKKVTAEAAKKRLAAEESRRKLMEDKKKIAEKKRAAMEEQKRIQDQARVKQEQTRLAIAQKNAEDRRRKLEVQRQEQIDAQKKQEAVRKAAANKKAGPELKKPSPQRPSISMPRPSLQILKPSSPQTPSTVQRRPSFSLPRPSLQIPKPSPPASIPKPVAKAPKVEKKPSFSLPRPSLSIPKTKLNRAPNGVPTVVGWTVRRDGGIEGQIFGSINFREGQRFETSPIVKGDLENGSVVTTKSGSRYFLSGRTAQEMKQEVAKSSSLPKELRIAAPSATIQLTRQARERDEKAALEAVSQAKPGRTISLSAIFGFGRDAETSTSSGTSGNSAPVKKEAPKGVPTIERWKAGGDKAITGFIRGASQFRDGEKITTSPIAKGKISSGELVVTSSGTKYFLK